MSPSCQIGVLEFEHAGYLRSDTGHLLSSSGQHIDNMIRAGVINAVNIGGRVLVIAEEIARIVGVEA